MAFVIKHQHDEDMQQKKNKSVYMSLVRCAFVVHWPTKNEEKNIL